MPKGLGILLLASTISGILTASGSPAAANPVLLVLVPRALAAAEGFAVGKKTGDAMSYWQGEEGVPGHSATIPEALYESSDGSACQVEGRLTPHGLRHVTICE